MAFQHVSFDVYRITRQFPKCIPCFQYKIQPHKFINGIMLSKEFSSQALTKQLELISNEKINLKKTGGKLQILPADYKRPLAVVFEWISAEKKVFYKYANLYVERGYDVLAVSLSVRQLLWPVSGSQVAAQDVLEFLLANPNYNPLLVHGFSIGGYVWGEVLVKMAADKNKYHPLLDKIKGQIWDSTPDVNDFYKGFPKAVFPNNAILRFLVEKSILYHLRVFENTATRHYRKASELFHNTPLMSPALLFIAKNDPVASYDTVVKLKEHWESLGIKVHLKSWEKSKHVSHLRLHQEDYIRTLDAFLEALENDKMHAKL